MKENIKSLIVLCLFTSTKTLFAQGQFGFRLGTNMSYLANGRFISLKPVSDINFSYIGGVSYERIIRPRFSLQSGINFARNKIISNNWLEADILAKIKIGQNKIRYGFVILGPSYSYGLKPELPAPNHGRTDLGVNIGGQINLGDAFFDIRYQLGQIDTLYVFYRQHGLYAEYTRTLSLTFGLHFPKNK